MKYVRYTLACIVTLILVVAVLMMPAAFILNFDLHLKVISVFNVAMMGWMTSDVWAWARKYR
jgi:hypothetical protein